MASMQPIPRLTERELLARMPDAAVWDMTEWQNLAPIEYFRAFVAREIAPESAFLDGSGTKTTAIRDDRPVNEFFFMRRFLRGEN
jgi:hypothetical protein